MSLKKWQRIYQNKNSFKPYLRQILLLKVIYARNQKQRRIDMPLKIVRNDITKMNTEIIVNTANDHLTIGTGCDFAIYQAAGRDELLAYRKERIGYVPEGEVFITPAFHLSAKHIIHAVSPYYEDGQHGEEEKLRSCYRKSLQLAHEVHAESIAFPLISTGGFGYPKEEGLRIAVDEINSFLLSHDMLIYLVVFDQKTSKLGTRLYPGLESYIDQKYVEEKRQEEYFGVYDTGNFVPSMASDTTAVLQVFSKIKNNVNYHPQKMTALCLCVGAKLNLDESRDLLARAGYALSPCDKTDVIFSYFIENKIYDMIELDIQLEEHGLPCIIS